MGKSVKTTALIATNLALVLVLARAAPAQTSDLNVREACRRAVAGAFLSAHDRTEKTKQQLAIVTAQRDELKTKLQGLATEMEGLMREEKKTAFSVELAAKKNGLMQSQDVYRTQIQSYEDLRNKAASDQQRYTGEEESIRRAMGPVFKLTRLPRTEVDAGYPFRVDYRHECPKYRRLCPLPDHMARSLKTIDILGNTPQACVRYASFSNLNGKQSR